MGMANEKMPPIPAILHELRGYCENFDAVQEAIDREQNPIRRQILKTSAIFENSSIGVLCDLLEIVIIPEEDRNTVITTVSELAAARGSHQVLGELLKNLKKPQMYGVLTPKERDGISGKLLRLKGDRYVSDTRGAGDVYCWECGHVAPKEEFLKENKCPNPDCPSPWNWND